MLYSKLPLVRGLTCTLYLQLSFAHFVQGNLPVALLQTLIKIRWRNGGTEHPKLSSSSQDMQSDQTVGEISTHQPDFQSTINRRSQSLQLPKCFLLWDLNLYPHKQPILEMSRTLEIGKEEDIKSKKTHFFFSVRGIYLRKNQHCCMGKKTPALQESKN